MYEETKQHFIGLPEMDEQHTYLYTLFNRLEKTSQVVNYDETKQLLDEIERYVIFHFSSEELLMKLYQVPTFAVHQTDHEQASKKIIDFMDDFERKKLNPSLMAYVLSKWLSEHSQFSDSLYVDHIKKVRGA